MVVTIMQLLGFDMTSRLIGSDRASLSNRQEGPKWKVASHVTAFGCQIPSTNITGVASLGWKVSHLSTNAVGELHFCLLCHPCTALDQASSLSRKLAYVPGPTFGFVKLLASSGSHCTKWADEQHWPAGFESRLVPDLPSPLSPL